MAQRSDDSAWKFYVSMDYRGCNWHECPLYVLKSCHFPQLPKSGCTHCIQYCQLRFQTLNEVFFIVSLTKCFFQYFTTISLKVLFQVCLVGGFSSCSNSYGWGSPYLYKIFLIMRNQLWDISSLITNWRIVLSTFFPDEILNKVSCLLWISKMQRLNFLKQIFVSQNI